jgi:hypothetical protein
MTRQTVAILGLLFALILQGSNFASAAGAGLGVSVDKKQIAVGESFAVDIVVSTKDQAANAVSGTFSFSESLVEVQSISKNTTIIDLWTVEPARARNKISFEGIILNPGYQGERGRIFTVNMRAKRTGTINFNFSEGAILANDGQGTNILTYLGTNKITVVPAPSGAIEEPLVPVTPTVLYPVLPVLPVITKHTEVVEPNSMGFLRGQGQPNAFTRLVFQDIYLKSAAEKFLDYVRRNKEKPEEALVKNNERGEFLYVSGENLVAGAYNIIPYLVGDTDASEKPGSGVQFLVKESPLVEWLIVLINILFLLVPIIVLVIVIYFIPWYSFKRMRVLRKKMVFEEEKIESSEQELLHHSQNTPDKPAQ